MDLNDTLHIRSARLRKLLSTFSEKVLKPGRAG